MAISLGFILPPIRIRDNMQINPNEYVVKVRGVKVASGEARPDEFLAMDSGMASAPLDEGTPTREPAFNLKAYWIPESAKPRAEALGYTVVDATTVVVTHLTEIIKRQASDLLTREEIRRLVDNLREKAPGLVEEVTPKVVAFGELQKVLQRLLTEQVSIRDLEVILEVLGDYGAKTKDVEVLTEYARNALAASICEKYREADGRLYVITLDAGIEETVASAVQHTEAGSFLALAPAAAEAIRSALAEQIEKQVAAGHQALILTGPQIRHHVRKLMEKDIPGITVLSFNEIVREVNVESVGIARITR
jgi:flagellar biosynthesis protein FlhA